MESKYSLTLNRFVHTANCYRENFESYKEQIAIDTELSSSSKSKMESLITNFISRIDEFILAAATIKPMIERIENGMAIESNDFTSKFRGLEDEYGNLGKVFEKLSVTTPKLMELKQKVDKEIELYACIQRETIKSCPTKITRVQVEDANDKWLDSLAHEVSQRNGKVKELAKNKTQFNNSPSSIKTNISKDVPTYLSTFKIVQDEFSCLKEQMKMLIKMQEEQNSTDLQSDVRKLLEKTNKVSDDNKIIEEGHSSLLHTLHVLCTI